MRLIDQYFFNQPEPAKSCLLFLRDYLLRVDVNVTEAWKYGMPFYCYKGKMFCYLWMHKKHRQPYIGFVDGHRIAHPDLLSEKRARMKILLINPVLDVPVEKIRTILNEALTIASGNVNGPKF